MIMFHVEFDDMAMRWIDWMQVAVDAAYIITGDEVADLREYVEGMGYDWNEVAYVFEVAA